MTQWRRPWQSQPESRWPGPGNRDVPVIVNAAARGPGHWQTDSASAGGPPRRPRGTESACLGLRLSEPPGPQAALNDSDSAEPDSDPARPGH